MTTYPLERSVFQDSASEVRYAGERMLWMWRWTKWQISVLGDIHIMLPFYLILTREPIIIVKNSLRVILSWRMLFEVALILGVCSIRVLAKNHGDPYYEPTIVVHDSGEMPTVI